MRRLAWRLINGLQAIFLFLWTAFWVTIALAARFVTGGPKLPLTIARKLWLPVALWTVGARLEVEISPLNDFSKPALFVANHRSFYDIPALVGGVPTNLRFLAKKEVRKIPFLGLYAAAMGMVFIDRSDSEASRTSVDLMSELLEDGASMASYPEGTRSRSGELLPFKTGSFVAAIKAAWEWITETASADCTSDLGGPTRGGRRGASSSGRDARTGRGPSCPAGLTGPGVAEAVARVQVLARRGSPPACGYSES